MAVQLERWEVKLGSFHLGPLSFQFEDTGLYLIRGKNGAGKTSLLRSLLGRIHAQGKLQGLKFPIGTVGLEPLLFGSWTVKENFVWIQKLMNLEQIQNLPHALKPTSQKRFSLLSQGWKRQVELTFALYLPFECLFLDEPLSPLDADTRPVFSEQIDQLAQKKLIIMTSHFEEDLKSKPKGVLELSC